jgi:hypothetical protein
MRCYCLECDAPVETEDAGGDRDEDGNGDTYAIDCPACGCTRGYEG